MNTLKFPDETLLRTITANKKLDEVLTLFSNILIGDPAGNWVPEFCKDWLRCTDAKTVGHKAIRTAVFFVVFERRVLVNAPVETYWDIVCRFGPTNHTAVVNYLNVAPKSVPLKMGRLLSAKAEFGVKPMPLQEFQQTIAVLFASPAISQGVITREWLRELASMRSAEAKLLTEMGRAYAPNGPVYSLVTLFPQINANLAHFLLVNTGESVEQLTQKMLDVPGFVSDTLNQLNADDTRPKKYIVLDNEEKQRRADARRQKQRLEFSYKYIDFDEEDPDPEAEDTVQQELTEADKKLVAQEQLLWSYWHSHKDVFDRKSRKTGLRKELRSKLNWTDEQIEGWGRVSAKSSLDNGKENLNIPKHFKEVDAYVPALREGTQVAPQALKTEPSGSPEPVSVHSRQKPANKQRKEGDKRLPPSAKKGGDKVAGKKTQKPSQQKSSQQQKKQTDT